MPAVAVLLSLDHAIYSKENNETKEAWLGDVVPFISGLLLGNDATIRNWFSLFIRNGQKVGGIFLVSCYLWLCDKKAQIASSAES